MGVCQKAIVVICLVVAVRSGPPPVPLGRSQQNSNYGYRYSVNDYQGNEQSHQQQRVGNAVKGQYKVLLPDGRLQTVTYVADEKGYRAKVDYTPALPGEATTAGLSTSASVPVADVVLPPSFPGAPAAGPITGTIYPGQYGYPPYPIYQGVGSYGSGLIYASPSTSLALANGIYGGADYGAYAGYGGVPVNGYGGGYGGMSYK